ncbi:hypothetical protein DVH24_017785 [Malus domestica]|uniref:SPX domain-containing protein n=1 Tax=Malus domestica TaxID=3750 RepID=A0A498KK78_MALDO|nr:hypothetical protein DVH24_017785 [Malus domestica]
MKFGKSLSNQMEETLPEWRDKFLSYKELKKRLKLIEPKGGERPAKRPRIDASAADCNDGGNKDGISAAEISFITLLEDELEKFNSFFLEKEEEYIIRLKEIQDRVAKAKPFPDEIMKIRKEIVDFHGEMVLLENYSALNYTGLVKILKKYDKRTGALMRLPFIQKVLQQPFFTMDLLYKLIKECEITLDYLFSMNDHPVSTEGSDGDDRCNPSTSAPIESHGVHRVTKELAEIESMESLYMKSIISALRALKEIRSGSSTVSVFSLPPLQMTGLEDAWKKVPVLEQLAKVLMVRFFIKSASAERNALPDLRLEGFEVIDEAKAQVEALVTVQVGQCLPKEGMAAPLCHLKPQNLPSPLDSVAAQRQKYVAKGLDDHDLITLGAHTIGETPCQFIRYRLYNFTSTGNSDPTINQAFLGS